jgi:hypothetical protein
MPRPCICDGCVNGWHANGERCRWCQGKGFVLDTDWPEPCWHGQRSGGAATPDPARRPSRGHASWTESDERSAENQLARALLRESAELRKRKWLRQFPPEQRLAMGGKLPSDHRGGTRFLPHDHERPLALINESTGRPREPRRLRPRLLDPDVLAQVRVECPAALDEPEGGGTTS